MNHQKLNCYQKLIRLVQGVQTQMPHWPTGLGFLKDQVRRAMSSSVLNLVEGNGRESPKDRRRFFVTSAASVAELSAALELVGIFYAPFASHAARVQPELKIIYAMIWKMH